MVYCIEPKGEFRKILMYTLESCGYTSEAIPSGKELLEVLKRHRPELILLDYDLPGEKEENDCGKRLLIHSVSLSYH